MKMHVILKTISTKMEMENNEGIVEMLANLRDAFVCPRGPYPAVN